MASFPQQCSTWTEKAHFPPVRCGKNTQGRTLVWNVSECYKASQRVCPFKGVENGHSKAGSCVCCYWLPSLVLRVRETVHSLTQSDISVGSPTMATFFQACLACSGWLHTLAARWLGTSVPSVPAFPWGSFSSMELASFSAFLQFLQALEIFFLIIFYIKK